MLGELFFLEVYAQKTNGIPDIGVNRDLTAKDSGVLGNLEETIFSYVGDEVTYALKI